MRRLYKIMIIIFVSIVFTIAIYYATLNHKENILALGDGIASGETSYRVDGLSYNDYLKEYYAKDSKLQNYDNNFSKKNYQLKDLIDDIKDNKKGSTYIKQLINNATIITVSIGMDEISQYAMTENITKEYINKYIAEYDDLIYILRELNKKHIIMIGFYPSKTISKKDVILLNANLNNIAQKYNTTYIDISDLASDYRYYLNNNSYYFNYKAQYKIFQMINCTITTCQK